jgi:hypothetical protein
MKPMNLEHVVRNIDRRLERAEQILPALPTREELDRKVAVLPTRDEMHAAIREAVAPLAARMDTIDQRITQEAEHSRTYTTIHYEDLKHDIRLLADGVVKVQTALDRRVVPKLDNHEQRITALEDARGQAGGGRKSPN